MQTFVGGQPVPIDRNGYSVAAVGPNHVILGVRARYTACRDIPQMSSEIYRLQPPGGFEWLLPVNQDDNALFRFDGTPRAQTWVPVEMERIKQSDRGKVAKPSDFPFGLELPRFFGHLT
jgi:hypothetical protein